MNEDRPGVLYTEVSLPATASSDATAYVAVMPNPFAGYAYVDSVEHIPIATVTGDNTNTTNFNVDLADGTEIANKDYPTGESGARGVAEAFTFTGSAAQRKIASGGCVLIEQEEVGVQPARIGGHKIRVGWKSKGI